MIFFLSFFFFFIFCALDYWHFGLFVVIAVNTFMEALKISPSNSSIFFLLGVTRVVFMNVEWRSLKALKLRSTNLSPLTLQDYLAKKKFRFPYLQYTVNCAYQIVSYANNLKAACFTLTTQYFFLYPFIIFISMSPNDFHAIFRI